jgi:hypothetical protein
MKFKKLKTSVAKDITKTVKTTTVKKNPIKNLGKYAHPTKLPTGAKVGKSTGAKTTKAKVLKMRAQKGAHLNV